MNLLENTLIRASAGGSTQGGGIAASTFIDMQGWDGVLFILTKSSTHAGSTGTLIVQQSSAASTGAGIMQSTFSNAAKWTTGLDHKPVVVDVVKPIKRYVRLRLLTCTGIIVTTVQYQGRRLGSTEAKAYVSSVSNVHVCTT